MHAHEPDTIYVVLITSDAYHYPPEGKLRVYRSRMGGTEWEALTRGLPQRDCYVNVLRDAMAVDTLDPCGVYSARLAGRSTAQPMPGTVGPPCPRSAACVVCGGPDAAMIRVVLPTHLRTLAR